MTERPSDINRRFYDGAGRGVADYWRKMPAPRRRDAVLLGWLEALTPRAVVDLGCGDGRFLEEVARVLPAARRGGVDLSPVRLAENQARRPGDLWEARDLSVAGDPAPEMRSAFDVVVAAEILEHVDDPLAFLRRARDYLRQGGGHLLLSTQSGPVSAVERRVGHVRHFSIDEVTDLLGRAGWAVERVWNEGYPFHDWSKRVAGWFPDASLRRFGGGAYGALNKAACALLRVAFRFNSTRRGAQLFAVAHGEGA